MAIIKIFLPTYRRNETFKRSINSLLAQTFTDWICEIHNDDPHDNFPSQYIQQLNDDRFKVVNHEVNYGPVETFNKAFENCAEEYVSILEDDNWWEPSFLKIMLATMEAYPQVRMAWANMKLWQEHADNKWVDLGKTIWPLTDKAVTIYDKPVYKQAFSALHSNGAMLVRNSHINALCLPLNVRFDFVEAVRERIIAYPILRVEKPLANFALTIKNGRESGLTGIFEHYLLLIDSYLIKYGCNQAVIDYLWLHARKSPIKTFNKLLFTGLICKASRPLLKKATIQEWIYFALYNIRHPKILLRCINAKRNYNQLWKVLKSAGHDYSEII